MLSKLRRKIRFNKEIILKLFWVINNFNIVFIIDKGKYKFIIKGFNNLLKSKNSIVNI